MFAYRCAKEAITASVVWKYKEPVEGEPPGDQLLTVLASTPEIISASISKLDGVELDYAYTELSEGVVYELTPTGAVSEGKIPSPVAMEDQFTSAKVEAADGTPLEG